MKLVIDRKRWLRNEGDMASYLLRSFDGKMCCLGFYLLACGASPDDIRDRTAPSRVATLPDQACWLTANPAPGMVHSRDTSDLMHLNDERSDDDPGREAALASLFAKHGVEVVFIDAPETAHVGEERSPK